MTTILHIDASARLDGSVSRSLSARLVEARRGPNGDVIRRDLADHPPLLTKTMIGGYFTPPEKRSLEQEAAIAHSDAVVAELQKADEIVIGAPIYNFGPPAALKAWADQAARAGVTFRYTENGPVGLLEGKKAFLVVASGGTPVGSEIDFLTPWARRFLGFLGVKDVTVIAAGGLVKAGDESVAAANAAINALATPVAA